MEEIVTLLKELIQFQSVHSKPEEITQCADFIEFFLKDIDADYQRFDHKGTPSILVMPPSGKVPILLMSHFDVVEGANDQFFPYEKNGQLYGRGSLDDKYAVALSLILLKNYLNRLRSMGLDQEDLPFGILLTGDEEKGGEDGANKVLAEVKTNFCIALDGGDVDQVVTKEKGIAVFKLISSGKSSHGARPWLGENAVDNLISDYQKIKSFSNQSRKAN